MPRATNWPDLMAEAIEKHRALPFQWGASDCFLMPIDCVLAMTGTDPTTRIKYRGYKSQKGAALRLQRNKCQNVGDAFALFFEEIHPAMASRGDIVTVPQGDIVGGGICIGAQIVCKGNPVGISFLPRSLATRAFRVA